MIKFLVVFFNFLFLVFGGLLIGIGTWTLINFGDYITLSESVPYATGPKVMIAAGVLIAVISFLGCCGAWKENKCMLIIFFIFLLIILGLEIAAAVMGYQHRDKLDDQLDKDVTRELKSHYGEEGSDGVTKAFDNLQQNEECCGWNNYTEWFSSKKFNGSHSVPTSCCKAEKDNSSCGKAPINLDNIYQDPCKQKLEKLVKEKLYYIGAVGVTVVVIQILGMIFALVLICKIGDKETYA